MIFISDEEILQDELLDEITIEHGLDMLIKMDLVNEGQRDLLNKYTGSNSNPVKAKNSGYKYNCEFNGGIISLSIYYDPTNPMAKLTAKQITTGIFDKRIDKTISTMEKNKILYGSEPFCVYITKDGGIYVMYSDADSVTKSNGWDTLGSCCVQQGSSKIAEIRAYRDEFN